MVDAMRPGEKGTHWRPYGLIVLTFLMIMTTVTIISRHESPRRGMQWAQSAPSRSKHQSATVSHAMHTTAPACTVRSTYTSSELEKAWLGNISNWQNDFCGHSNHTTQLTHAWVKAQAVYIGALQQGQQNPTIVLEQQLMLDTTIFSKFVTTIECDWGSSEQVSWIEPLAHGLRHPHSLCQPLTSVFDRSYLVVAHGSEITNRRQHSRHRCQGRSCQAIYIDLGATTLQPGPGEPGQGWFFHTYAKQGVEFDRYLLWEAVPRKPEEVFKNVPKQSLDKYQYYNIPVTADTSDPSNPVSMLKRIAQPGDFVVFKLDIDNWSIEAALMKALFADKAALELIDEFFHEDHVNFQQMYKWWDWNKQYDPNRTLADSYAQFLKLRQMGIRAHPWV